MHDWTDEDIFLDSLLSNRLKLQRAHRFGILNKASADHLVSVINQQIEWAVAYISLGDLDKVLKK
jgi:hypothetical protein